MIQKSQKIRDEAREIEPEVAELKGLDVEAVDLELPAEVMTRLAAQERYGHLGNYYRVSWSLQANRAVGNEAEVQRLAKALAASRMAVALIDKKYPAAKEEMRHLAAQDIQRLRAQREAVG